MFIIVCCPRHHRSDFSVTVDEVLSREMDWNLTSFTAGDPSSTSPLSSGQYLVKISVGLSDPAKFATIFQRPLDPSMLDQVIGHHMDTWIFDLSPVCTLLQLQHAIDYFHGLGCFIGLSAYSPSEGRLISQL